MEGMSDGESEGVRKKSKDGGHDLRSKEGDARKAEVGKLTPDLIISELEPPLSMQLSGLVHLLFLHPPHFFMSSSYLSSSYFSFFVRL